jgi:Flp pilus assembly protein TadD
MRVKLDHRWPVILPALLVFLVYLPALGCGFVWDDTIFLRDMPLYRDPALWSQALRAPFVLSPNYFRPLALLTFMAELRLGGLNPALFHLTNLLLHALNTVLVGLLARHLGRDVRQAHADRKPSNDVWPPWLVTAGAALLYGLHPALVESIAFVSSRFDLLLTTFLLLALLADVRLRHPVARPLAVGLAFLLAALTKEMALALVLMLPLWHCGAMGKWANGQMANGRAEKDYGRLQKLRKGAFIFLRRRTVGDLGVYAALLIAGVVYLIIRHAALGYLLLPQAGHPIPTGGPVQHLLLVGQSLAAYARLIVWPFTSLGPIHYGPLPVPTHALAPWISLGAALLLLAGLVKWARIAPRSGGLAVAGLLSTLPVVNLLPLELGGGAFVAERFLTFPLALFVLAAVPLLARWQRSAIRKREAGGKKQESSCALTLPHSHTLLLLWLAACVVTIQITLPHWRDDLSLWTWAARRAPQSATPPTNLALQYVNRGDYSAGLEAAGRALELDPANADAWDNAGLALFYLERYAEAQDAFERAVELEPESALYWNNLAGALREQDQLGAAEQVLLDQALRLDPTLPAAHLSLGIVYLRADRPDLAAGYLQGALRLLPPGQTDQAQTLLEQTQEPGRWLRLGDLLLAHGDPQEALRAFEQAGLLSARPADVAAGQSAALIQLGAWPEAEALLGSALALTPDDARLHNNLGVAAREQERMDAARVHFARAAELAPAWDLPHQNLAGLERP